MDYIEAYGWIYFAAKDGDTQATKNLAQLKEILGAKIEKAEARAKEIKTAIEKTTKP